MGFYGALDDVAPDAWPLVVRDAIEEPHRDGFLEALHRQSHARVVATREDPLLFALLYLRHHLTDEHGTVTLAEWHRDLLEQARQWAFTRPGFKTHRDAYIASRDSGKSTWLFLILPMWAAAHGHHRFVAALADSGSQAADHLQTFTMELDSNELLRRDYPALCKPMTRRSGRRREIADNRWTTIRDNGLVFMARGLDSAVLGMKVGNRRPDLIILDDVEPGEERYSAAQAKKRLNALRDTVLPLNNAARVVLAGTVTMAGSIIHQLVLSVTSKEPAEGWILEERFRVHYYPALITGDDGGERSVWPEKWPLELLRGMRHHRAFAKNFQNLPVPEDGDYWAPADFQILVPSGFGRTVLSIDPAVTKTQTSDYYGFSVVSRGPDNGRWRVFVREGFSARLAPAPFRDRVLGVLEDFPDVGLVLVESNQGGDLWRPILHGLPCRLKLITQSEPKHVRAARALNDYQRGRVFHTRRLPKVEAEMMAFPHGLHDDALDATVSGVLYFLDQDRARQQAKRGKASQQSYR